MYVIYSVITYVNSLYNAHIHIHKPITYPYSYLFIKYSDSLIACSHFGLARFSAVRPVGSLASDNWRTIRGYVSKMISTASILLSFCISLIHAYWCILSSICSYVSGCIGSMYFDNSYNTSAFILRLIASSIAILPSSSSLLPRYVYLLIASSTRASETLIARKARCIGSLRNCW